MRGRFTTLIQQPFAVQDVEFTIVGFDPDPADAGTKSRLLSTSSQKAEWPCRLMPKAIYVAPRKNRPPWGYRGGVYRGSLYPGSPQNLINHYFGYQIRILRGRFTPGGFLLKQVF